MNNSRAVVEHSDELQKITHIVSQIENLRENIHTNLQNKRYPAQEVLEVMADAMEKVDGITGINPKNSKWEELYVELRCGGIPDHLCDRIVEWQKETLNWVDHMESRRLIHIMQEEIQRQDGLIQRLLGNPYVQRGWYEEINREKINYILETDHSLGVTTQKRERQIIVSLTSYPDRMYELKYTLYSLLHQSLKPDRIIVWLAEEQFPGKEADLAPSLLKLCERGITIQWCEDIKSYKKLIPALKRYPEDIIVTADDDIYYQENWLEMLYNSYLECPNCVHCHRAHKIQTTSCGFAPYHTWDKMVAAEQPVFWAFPTGGGGILYPPHVLYQDICCREMFMEVAPSADDVWFWAMSVLNGTKIRIVSDGVKRPVAVNRLRELGFTDETTLYASNGALMWNDICLDKVLRKYPVLISILRSDYGTDIQEGKELG